MTPASEVGGDYYDAFPALGDGTFIGIGDIAGHVRVQMAFVTMTLQRQREGPLAQGR